tara:strand:- start:69 stop:1070 length:1002 start_codon:yes stop_codon:yes gene_type:complete
MAKPSKNEKTGKKNTASTRSTKVKPENTMMSEVKETTKVVKTLRKNITSTGAMTSELERVVQDCMTFHVSVANLGEFIDLNKFKVLVTVEPPKNSAGTTTKDANTLGHFTVTDQWQDSKGTGYRAININPFTLRDMKPAEIVATCYHEGIHAINDMMDQCEPNPTTGKVKHNTKLDTCHHDCSSNGRHLAKFATEAEAGVGILKATKLPKGDYRGYSTKLTTEGKKLAKEIAPKTEIFSKNIKPKKASAPKAKRVSIECNRCGLKSGIPFGNWVRGMVQISSNESTVWEGQWDIPVQQCLACDVGMVPTLPIAFSDEEILKYTNAPLTVLTSK